MSRNLADLRVIVKDNDLYATAACLAQHKNGDIYGGPKIKWAAKLVEKQLFRHSYHEDGTTFLHCLAGRRKQASPILPPI